MTKHRNYFNLNGRDAIVSPTGATPTGATPTGANESADIKVLRSLAKAKGLTVPPDDIPLTPEQITYFTQMLGVPSLDPGKQG